MRLAYGFNVNKGKATRLGRTNKKAKYTLDGIFLEEAKEETDLLAAVAAKQANRALECIGQTQLQAEGDSSSPDLAT